ncbi:hypothetical protein D9M72_601460 [compost metagenome]
MRLPMKPSVTPETTGNLPRRLTKASALASTSGVVLAQLTTSTSRMTLAGEKKCKPTTRDGSAVAAAIASGSR